MNRSYKKPNSKKEFWHSWNDDDKNGVYFIRDYHTCNITINRYNIGENDPVNNYEFKEITYIPLLCGIRLNRSWDNTYDDHPIYFKSLKSAKYHACKKWDLNRAEYPLLFKDLRQGGSIIKNLVKRNIEFMNSRNFNYYGD